MDSAYSFPAELTAPSELRGGTPRRALFTGSGLQMAIAAALLLAFAAAGAVWVGTDAARQGRRNAALRNSGVETRGTITQLQASGSIQPRVSYTFSANGRTFSGTVPVPDGLAHILESAGSLPVIYLPANPDVNHPAAWQQSTSSKLALLVAPATAVVFGLLLFVPLIVEHRMATGGRPVLATVTKCTHARRGFLLNYEFRLQDDSPIKGRGWCKNHREPGSGMWVIYLPKHPRRNLPYPLTYCRVIG